MNLSFGQALDLRTAIENEPPPIEHIIRGLGPRYVGAFVGAGGVGKGYVMMSIAIGIATGGAHDEIGLVPANSPPRRVLILGAEDDHLVTRHRYYRAGTHILKDLREMLYENLTMVCTLGSTPSLVGAFGVVNEKIVDELITAAHGYDRSFHRPTAEILERR